MKLTKDEKLLLLLACLRNNSRATLTSLNKITGTPVSTLFDHVKLLIKNGSVKKYTALLDFQNLGYGASAFIMLGVKRVDRDKLFGFLKSHSNVNCLFKINSGWDYIVEVVFPNMKDVENFIETMNDKIPSLKSQIFYILDEIKRESFMSNPEIVKMKLNGRR